MLMWLLAGTLENPKGIGERALQISGVGIAAIADNEFISV
jgi:hypothetical protein